MKLQNIKLNEKYTILTSGSDILSSAMSTVIKCTIIDIQLVQYAQYDNAIQIRYRAFRKRKDSILTILNHEDLVILKGHHDINGIIESKIDDNSSYLNPNSPSNYLNHCDLIFKKDIYECIEVNTNYDYLIDTTTEYLIEASLLSGISSIDCKDSRYYKLLKDTLLKFNYSINDNMLDYINAEGCVNLVNDIKKVRFTVYDI